MRRWGLIVTLFYALVLLLLLLPGALALASKHVTVTSLLRYTIEGLSSGYLWICAGILAAGEALLLFLSVDSTWRRHRPRAHVAVTALLTGFFIALLASAAIWSLWIGFPWPLWNLGRSLNEAFLIEAVTVFASFWALWGALFYLYYRDASNPVAAAVSWLLKGSVLELLIAVPTHVVVRQRGDCTAPHVTAYGIVTGIAIMLLCFGPGVLALYRKKYDAYRGSNAERG
ncbi:MAG: hypothetical protein R3357_07660 [Burkholderiales bacterium]|nr:hypothetical protein [Burkholderiales bacterium]